MLPTFNTIEVWAPRFHDKKVLIAPYKVQNGMNRIIFTKTMRDKRLLMDGAKIKSYPMESNGTIGCHAVPMKDFEMEKTDQEELFPKNASPQEKAYLKTLPTFPKPEYGDGDE